MDKDKIEKICGMIPDGFIKAVSKDSNFIFQNDPNFPPTNLYDFFARAVTVNSFQECFYYAELGFEPNKFIIFDYASWLGISAFFGFITFMIYRKNLIDRFLRFFRVNKNIKKLSYIRIDKKKSHLLFVGSLLFQFVIFFDYVQSKALSIPRFIDEYSIELKSDSCRDAYLSG